MAVNPRKLRVTAKENTSEKLKNIHAKKISTNNNVGTKRTALGDLGNKTVAANKNEKVINKDAKSQLVVVKPTKPAVKPRVQATLEPVKKLSTESNSNKSAIPEHINKIKLEKLLAIREKITEKNCAELKELAKEIDKIYSQSKPKRQSSLPKKTEIKSERKTAETPDEERFKELLAFREKIARIDCMELRKVANFIDKTYRDYQNRLIKKSDIKVECKNEVSTTSDDTKSFNFLHDEPIGHSTQLLSVVEDIDIDDGDNPMLLAEYVNDVYAHLYHLEVQFPIKENHLEEHEEITPRMRSILIDWIAEVHSQFRLIPETYFMTISIIDQYLQADPTTTRENLQLVGVCALFIATKYEELFPVDIEDYIYITDTAYSKSNILAMEKKILKVLDFQLCRPLPIHFLRRYSKAAKAINDHHLLSKYFIELVTLNYTFAHYKPSEVAAASLYLSLQLLRQNVETLDDSLWTPTLQHYSRYTVDDLKPIVKQLAKVVLNAPKSKLSFIYKKYCMTKFYKIAAMDVLYSPFMKKISSSHEE